MTQQNQEDLMLYAYIVTIHNICERRNALLTEILNLTECKSGYKNPYESLSKIRSKIYEVFNSKHTIDDSVSTTDKKRAD